MARKVVALAIPLLLGACASRVAALEPAASISPAASARGLEGVWHGVLTGREIVTASGIMDVRETLTIQPDGSWSLTSENGHAAGRIVGTTRQGLALDGRFTSGGNAGAPVRYVLARQGARGLVGSGNDFFLGHEVQGDVALQRE